jgi:hypothetical protein
MKRFTILSVLFSTMLSSCVFVGGKRIRGNGKITTQNRTVNAFTSVDVRSSIDVYVKQDSVVSVKIEADENLLEYVQVTVDNGTLDIREEKGYNLRSTKGIKVYVSGPSFKHFEASGACDIYSENQINSTGPISIDLSGACDVKMDLKTPAINVDLSGAGKITLKGETKDFDVDGSGSTNVRCFELMTENTRVEMSGAGDAEVFASLKLDVHVSGAADVKYKGNAAVNQNVSGAGSVKKVE